MSDLRRRSCHLLYLIAVVLLFAPSAGAFAAVPSALESHLTISIDGGERTLTLAEAMDTLNTPSASLALIDRDGIAFARAYGPGVTPEMLYQAASLSKFVAAIGARRRTL